VGLIPRPFIDELLGQTDIVAFIDSFVPLKKQGHSFVACCPFHHEKTPSFNVIPKKQFYHCFGCGVSGNAISFAMAYLHQNFTEAVETLAVRAGLQVPRDATHRTQTQVNLYQLLAYVALFYQKALHLGTQPALVYLKTRGVEGEVLEKYQLGYAPPGWHTLTQTKAFKAHQDALCTSGMLIQKEGSHTYYDRYRHRVIFPIHDKKGRIIGFGGRALQKEDKPKYLNSPETPIFHKNRELYGLYQVLQHTSRPEKIIVVEGYMDVITLAQYGIPNAVATLGTATSSFHIQLLAQYTSHIVFCFDGDLAGQQAAQKALESLLPALDSALTASFIFLPEEHDPDSYVRAVGQSGFTHALTEAQPLDQYLISLMITDIDRSTVQGKNQLIHQAKPWLEKIPECPFKSLILQEVTRLTGLDISQLNPLFRSQQILEQPSLQTIKRTPTRIAAALLIQYPEIYLTLTAEFPASDFKAHRLIAHLMTLIQTQPHLSTAAIIERFRDTSAFEIIQKLASFDTLVSLDTLKEELRDTLIFLRKQIQEKEIQTLLKRAKEQGLNEEERQKLQHLVKQKKTTSMLGQGSL
jgi:DNA primase